MAPATGLSAPDRANIFQQLVDSLREALGCSYAALADGTARDGPPPFYFSTPPGCAWAERMPHPPRGRGLIAHMMTREAPLRLEDLRAHPAAAGFPGGHAPMRSFLGSPILLDDRLLGALYATDKADGFTEADEQMIALFARSAALAIENSTLCQEIQALLADVQTSRDSYLAIVEHSGDAVLVTDLRGTLRYVNAPAEALFGLSREELVGDPFGQLQVAPGGSELDVHRADGLHRLVEARASDTTWYGEPARLITLRDVTARRELEEQLRHSQRMDAIGQLAGGVAHDFNNIICAVDCYADLALKKIAPTDPLHHDVSEIGRVIRRAAHLTEQLLAYSRTQVEQPSPCDLVRVAHEIEPMLRRLIGAHIELELRASKTIGLVAVERGQLQQVLLNLVLNARDAMPRGGRIRLEMANVRLDHRFAASHPGIQPGPAVLLRVSDTGFGIDEEIRSRIFEPFFTTKAVDQGTGLGLSTVYGIVRRAGGVVLVSSEPGQGAVFEVYLPRVSDASSRRGAPGSPPVPPTGHETILLVEDDETLRPLLEQVLAQSGYRVFASPNGQHALQTCEDLTVDVDLLLTDVVMPGLYGDELARMVERRYPEMRTLYMSGYAAARRGPIPEARAPRPLLEKPFRSNALLNKVREVLDGVSR